MIILRYTFQRHKANKLRDISLPVSLNFNNLCSVAIAKFSNKV